MSSERLSIRVSPTLVVHGGTREHTMNLVRTDRIWVRSPLEVCVRILLHGTGHHEARLEKKNLSAGSDGAVFAGKTRDSD
jgi:hypothetical protein